MTSPPQTADINEIVGVSSLEGNPPGAILLLACGALAKEILDLLRVNRWTHLDLMCLPAKLHLYPRRIPQEVEKAVKKYNQHYRKIFVVYADCGTGGLLKSKCDELGVEMIEGPHCYSFYTGNDSFADQADDEITSFYLTDFLVRQFDAFVWKPLGLDRSPALRDLYFGNYTSLIYLAQTFDQQLDEIARQCAKRLELSYERRFTGYGDLEVALKNLPTRGLTAIVDPQSESDSESR